MRIQIETNQSYKVHDRLNNQIFIDRATAPTTIYYNKKDCDITLINEYVPSRKYISETSDLKAWLKSVEDSDDRKIIDLLRNPQWCERYIKILNEKYNTNYSTSDLKFIFLEHMYMHITDDEKSTEEKKLRRSIYHKKYHNREEYDDVLFPDCTLEYRKNYYRANRERLNQKAKERYRAKINK